MVAPTPRVFDAARDVLDFEFNYNKQETNALRESLRRRADISIDDLRRVALWKLNRVLEVPDRVIERLQMLADVPDLTADSVLSREVLVMLVGCRGVGFPMASAFLKFLRPDIFPIIDVRAFRALTGRRLGQHSYDIDLYLNYVKQIQAIARATGRPLWEIDEQLYCFDDHHNGAINV